MILTAEWTVGKFLESHDLMYDQFLKLVAYAIAEGGDSPERLLQELTEFSSALLRRTNCSGSPRARLIDRAWDRASPSIADRLRAKIGDNYETLLIDLVCDPE